MKGKQLDLIQVDDISLEKITIPFSSDNLKRVNTIFNINSIFIQNIVNFDHNNFEIIIFVERFRPHNRNILAGLDSDEIEKIYVQFICLFEVAKHFGFDFIDFKNFILKKDSGIQFALNLNAGKKAAQTDIIETFRHNHRFRNINGQNYLKIFERLVKKHHFPEDKCYFYRKGDFASNMIVSYPYDNSNNDLNIKINIKTKNHVQKCIVKSILRQHFYSDEILYINIDGSSDSVPFDILSSITKEDVPHFDDVLDIVYEFKTQLEKSVYKSVVFILDHIHTREEEEFVRYLLDTFNSANFILISFDGCVPVDFDLVLNEKPKNLFNQYIKCYPKTNHSALSEKEFRVIRDLKILDVPVPNGELDEIFTAEEIAIIGDLVQKKVLQSGSGIVSINPAQEPKTINISIQEKNKYIRDLLPRVKSINLRICILLKTENICQLRNIFREILEGVWENVNLEILKISLIDSYSILLEDSELVESVITLLIRENEFDLSQKIISDFRDKNRNFVNLKHASIFYLEKDYQSMIRELQKVNNSLEDRFKDEYHFLMFIYYEKVSDYENADRVFNKIEGDLFCQKAHIQMSDRHIYGGDHEVAECMLNEAVDFFHKIRSFRDELMALNQLAKLLREKREFRSSEKLYKNIFMKSEIKKYCLISGFIAVDVGNLYWIQDMFNQAEYWYQKAWQIFEKENNKNGKMLVESNMVEVKKIKGNWIDAEAYLKATLKYDQEKNLLLSKAIDLYNISHLEYMRRNFNAALEVVEQALVLFKQKNNLNGIIECLFLKSKLLFFLNSPDAALNILHEYYEKLNSDQKEVLWLLNQMGGDCSGNSIKALKKKIDGIESRTLRFEILLLLIHKYGANGFSDSLRSLSIVLSQKSKNYFYYEYFWMYFIYLDSPENIGKEEKAIFIDMYYFFLKNKRKIPPVIHSIKKSLDDRDSVYDIFKSAELVGDYIHWKIPEDFFKSFLKELSDKIKVNLVKLRIFEGDELLFHFTNRIEFEELHNEMIARAISMAEHLNLNRSAVKKTFKSEEKFFYPYAHTKIILWKISPKLSGIVLLAFVHDEYNNIDIFENYQGFFRQFGSLIQKFQENDFQLNKKLDFIVGKSTSMKNLKQQILQVSKVDFSLLITGESGSGKELVAKAVHLLSKRSKKPFVTVNSAAIPEYLLEAELFGYKAGAFTGATDNRMGLIESADSGTLFLDEIADLPMQLQAKLLRVLQENEIRRLGENEIRKIDVRLISATNRDLDELIKIEHFREDLFFRIQDLTIRVPNLKQREDDIELLIRYFLNRYGFALDDELEFQGIVEEFKQKTWKGNVRELESHIKRLITFYPGGETKKNYRQQGNTGLKIAKANFEKSLIIKTLSENNWHKAKSAKQLKISRVYLFELIKKYNIRKNVN